MIGAPTADEVLVIAWAAVYLIYFSMEWLPLGVCDYACACWGCCLGLPHEDRVPDACCALLLIDSCADC